MIDYNTYTIDLQSFSPHMCERIYDNLCNGECWGVLILTYDNTLHVADLQWRQGPGNNYFFRVGDGWGEFDVDVNDVKSYTLLNEDQNDLDIVGVVVRDHK